MLPVSPNERVKAGGSQYELADTRRRHPDSQRNRGIASCRRSHSSEQNPQTPGKFLINISDSNKWGENRRPEGGGSACLLLSLFLLLLAFFILLNAISTRTEVKSRAVISSLLSTFRTTQDASTAEIFVSTLGSTPEPEELVSEMKRLWVTAVPVTEVSVMTDGRAMQLKLPSNAIFPGGEALLRKDRKDLLKTVAAVLATKVPGFNNELEVLIGTDWKAGEPLNLERENLEIARAEEFVTELVAAGAPSDSVSIGVREGDGRELQFRFFVRSKAAARVEFQRYSE